MKQRSLERSAYIGMLAIAAFICLSAAPAFSATKDEVDAAKNEIDLRTYQAIGDLKVQQSEAEARKAIAEAERAEALAKLPPTDIKALSGSINSEKFGAAGLVKAFDLAKELAAQVCGEVGFEPLPTGRPQGERAQRPFAIYDAATVQGMVAARTMVDELERLQKDTTSTTAGIVAQLPREAADITTKAVAPAVALGVVTGTIKAAADLASLFKTNYAVTGTGFGDGARSLFVTAMAAQCPGQLKGLGAGYLGELNIARYTTLRNTVNTLILARKTLAERMADLKKFADTDKNPKKAELLELHAAAAIFLKRLDGFLEAIRPSDATDKSPLFNAAKYLTYAERTGNANLLDFDIRLEGLTITRENIFVGQRLRLSGVAFITYRLYGVDGALKAANALRRITQPIEIDLGGKSADSEFWNGPGQAVMVK